MIVGALLLILITVIAAAGLAMIASQAEKQQADRQAVQDAIKNEKLVIVGIRPIFDISSPDYNTINITIQNLNVQNSSVSGISINDGKGDDYFLKYECGGHTYNYTDRLVIPASGSVTVRLDASKLVKPDTLQNSNPMTISLWTSYSNIFAKTIKPPIALIKTDIGTENVGITQRDYLILDGSGSSADGEVLSWNWKVVDGSGTWPYPGNWNDLETGSNFTYYYPTGKSVRWTPTSSGPFMVFLNITDDNGVRSQDTSLIIPADSSFDPPTTLNAYRNGSNVTAKVTDAYNNPMRGILVYFNVMVDKLGNMALKPFTGVTDMNGTTTVSIINGSNGEPMVINGTSGSVIHITAGSLTPVDISA